MLLLTQIFHACFFSVLFPNCSAKERLLSFSSHCYSLFYIDIGTNRYDVTIGLRVAFFRSHWIECWEQRDIIENERCKAIDEWNETQPTTTLHVRPLYALQTKETGRNFQSFSQAFMLTFNLFIYLFLAFFSCQLIRLLIHSQKKFICICLRDKRFFLHVSVFSSGPILIDGIY